MIPYGRQDIRKQDIDKVAEVLTSDFLTQGPVVSEFESAVREYCGAKYSLALNSATSALHAACVALELGSGDYLWTTPITFVASSNCGLLCNAKVDFVDIDRETNNLCPIELRKKLEKAKLEGRLPKVVVIVHLAGLPCQMKEIFELSKEYNFKIIEDASHAIGGEYFEDKIGSCAYSDFTVFSFHPVKIITTGEGGMLLSNQQTLIEKASLFACHGVTRDSKKMTKEPDGSWYYQMISLGHNFRMSDIHAALGVSQFSRLDEYIGRRHEIADFYDDQLVCLPIQLPLRKAPYYSGLHLYVIRLQLNKLDKSHTEIFEELRAKGVGVNLHYIPINTQPYYLDMGFTGQECPNALAYYSEAISLPMYPSITDEQLAKVVAVLKEVLR